MGERNVVIESLKVIAIYAVIGMLYIIFSDRLLALFTDDMTRITQLQTAKGIAYVLATSALLYLLIRRLERRLQLHDERYRGVFQANPVPMWVVDLHDLAILEVNNTACERYGYSRAQFLALTLADLHPPEEAPRLRTTVHEMGTTGHTGSTGQTWRHYIKDGSPIWVDAHVHNMTFDDRKTALVVARDITARIQVEETLRLNAEVFEHSQQGIMVTDHNNVIIMVNTAFEQITGYSREDVLGRNPSLLNSGRQSPEFYSNMWQEIERTGHWQGEVWNRNKSGEIYPERLSVSTIRDDDGNIIKYIGIFSDTSDEKQAEARIDFLAHFDPLTNLPNRSRLLQNLERMVRDADEQPFEITVMIVDLDRFKNINDGLGYEVGNKVLLEIARRLSELLGEHQSVYRQSSDEFTLLLPDCNVEQAATMAELTLARVCQPVMVEGQEVSFTASVGMAMYPRNARQTEELLQRADSALSRAKASGRNNYQFFDEASQTQSLAFMKIEHGLRSAVAKGELILHYQPLYDSASGKLSGLEALVRWQHPEWGLVPPDQFIPVAEESGQIVEIGDWIMRTATQQAGEWHRNLGLSVPVGINISVIQFQHPSLKQQLSAALSAAALPPELVCLEITESIAMESSATSIRTIAELDALGVLIAIDDFGSGYSSLNYLKRLSVDKLKLDRDFIADIIDDPRDASIVKAIIQLAHSLGFTTVAEGVETEAQYERLKEVDCDEIQGFLFSRPLSVTDCEALLRSQQQANVQHGQ